VRLLIVRLENLTPARFILLVGLSAGVLQGIPTLLFSNESGGHSIQFPVVAGLTLISLTAAALLWLVAVRRERFSVWRMAWYVCLGLILGDLLALALSMVAASIETNGAFVSAYIHAPLSVTLPGLVVPTLLRSPIWFFGSAVLIAIGRSLRWRTTPPFARHSSPTTDREAVT
jgi:hypothetical protein